jgi:hypothetical protein
LLGIGRIRDGELRDLYMVMIDVVVLDVSVGAMGGGLYTLFSCLYIF